MSQSSKPTGYDKYVNYKTFSIAVVAFIILLLIPAPKSMLDVGVEYSAGQDHVQEFFAEQLFGQDYGKVQQWQALTVRILEANMLQGVLDRKSVLKRDRKAIQKLGIVCSEEHFQQYRSHIESLYDGDFSDLMK
ncbi:MAG: hypothetical protein HN348_20945, partial [Proteobacteria bacterium]|nr:hypothetical protein [Pseudomonadota bacterium]